MSDSRRTGLSCLGAEPSTIDIRNERIILSEENIARYRQRFEIVKRLEKTYGIYRRFQFSGVPAPTDSDWHWWGKLDEDGYGAVVVVRGSGGQGHRAVNIPWVESERRIA